jgi:plastocyanin
MHRRTLLIALALSIAILPACGGGDSGSSPDCPPKADTREVVNNEITVCAFDPASYDVKTIKAPIGVFNVTLINKGSLPHNLKIEDNDFFIETGNKNEVTSGSATLPLGRHNFECTVPGHAAAGMKGVIEVAQTGEPNNPNA